MGFVRHRDADGTWEGVAPRDYTSGAVRQVLIGREHGATQVELRYFTIPVDGASTLERHPHEHAIMVLRGRAEVRLDTTHTEVGPGDVIFVAADEVHQLRTIGDEPLGFFCTALADRTARPQPPTT